MAAELCPYCDADLDETPPRLEKGYLYGLQCGRCPPEARRRVVLPRAERVAELACPYCGDPKRSPDEHPDILVVKEMVYEVCPNCGERCGVFSARRLIDWSEMTM